MHCTFTTGLSSSKSASSSLSPWLRAAKMFPPWKTAQMLYTNIASMTWGWAVNQWLTLFFLFPLVEAMTGGKKESVKTAERNRTVTALQGPGLKSHTWFFIFILIPITSLCRKLFQLQHQVLMLVVICFSNSSFLSVSLFFLRLKNLWKQEQCLSQVTTY